MLILRQSLRAVILAGAEGEDCQLSATPFRRITHMLSDPTQLKIVPVVLLD